MQAPRKSSIWLDPNWLFNGDVKTQSSTKNLFVFNLKMQSNQNVLSKGLMGDMKHSKLNVKNWSCKCKMIKESTVLQMTILVCYFIKY